MQRVADLDHRDAIFDHRLAGDLNRFDIDRLDPDDLADKHRIDLGQLRAGHERHRHVGASDPQHFDLTGLSNLNLNLNRGRCTAGPAGPAATSATRLTGLSGAAGPALS
jgi:hypothetical protein